MSSKQGLLPITIISGCLGAGKSTLLSSLLRNNTKHKIAILVNDMSAVNVDSHLLGLLTNKVSDDILEFTNGCVCCTLREDMFKVIQKLYEEDGYDYIVLECTGVADPSKIAANFEIDIESGISLKEVSYIDNIVTLIDGERFLSDFFSFEIPKEEEGNAYERALSEILVNQIEFASQIIISKCDLIDDAQILEITRIVKSLNQQSPIKLSYGDNTNHNDILNVQRYDKALVVNTQGWFNAISNESSLHEKSEVQALGLESFVWRARVPLHPGRFLNFINTKFRYGRLIRSKGLFWLATRVQEVGVWQSTGIVITTRHGGLWWRYTRANALQ